MKTGVIILFDNFNEEIDVLFLTDNFKKIKNIEFCIVYANCEDDILERLIELTEYCENVSMVNVKRFKTELSAIRAGMRYLWNEYGIEQICYIVLKSSSSTSNELSYLVKEIDEKEDFIRNYKRNVYVEGQTRKTLFQNLFPLVEYLKDYHVYVEEADV